MIITEHRLLVLALLLSFAGLILLYYYSLITEPVSISISELSPALMNKRVRVHGWITSVHEQNSILFFQLRDTNRVSVQLFHPTLEQKAILQPRSFVTLIARVTEYDGEIRLRAEQVIEDVS